MNWHLFIHALEFLALVGMFALIWVIRKEKKT